MATLPPLKFPSGEIQTIPARSGVAVPVRRDQTIKVINTHGSQVVDFWAVSPDLRSRLSMCHSRAYNLHLSPNPGDTLMDNHRKPMLVFEKDNTPGGVHDTLIAACDLERYRQLGVPEGSYHDNCADNFRKALQRDLDITTTDTPPDPLNLFMNIPVRSLQESALVSSGTTRTNPDGIVNLSAGAELSFEAPVCRPGDWVRLRAVVDCVVVMSACPQDILKINNQNPTEAHFVVE